MGQETNLERSWGTQEAERYRRSRHGPDGRHFLDPYIASFLFTAGKHGPLLDVGTGAAAIAIEAVRDHGVPYVYGIDKSSAMIDMAREAVRKAGLSSAIHLWKGNAASLSCKDSRFNRIISVNVGCNLDNETLAAHLREMARVVTREGQILFAVPINLGELFSNGDLVGVRSRLIQSLTTIEEEATTADGTVSQAMIQKHLGDIEQIHRGTFVVRNGHLRLVANGRRFLGGIQRYTVDDLQEADPIWRKLPGLVVPNNYHSQAFYEREIQKAGLRVDKKTVGCFASAEARIAYNDVVGDDPSKRLGTEYDEKGPFAVYIMAKR